MGIVIATRDRPALLRRCLERIAPQLSSGSEVVVVDDGSSPPIDLSRLIDWDSEARLRIERTVGIGPGPARNVGWQAASAPLILFVDDDVLPSAEWVAEAIRVAVTEKADVVEGRTTTDPWDPLFQHTAAADGPLHFLSCNVLYRRGLLESVGGFDSGFRFPHCEDRDLGMRALLVGRVAFAPNMLVHHPPRPVGVRALIRRALWIESEYRLLSRHPQLRYGASDRSLWARPLIGLLRNMTTLALWPRQSNPATWLRLTVVLAGQLILGCVATMWLVKVHLLERPDTWTPDGPGLHAGSIP